MPQVLYSFTFNTDTKDYIARGNVNSQVALQIMQLIAMTDFANQAKMQAALEKEKGKAKPKGKKK